MISGLKMNGLQSAILSREYTNPDGITRAGCTYCGSCGFYLCSVHAKGDAAVAVIAYRGLLLTIPAVLGLPALAVLRRRLRDEQHDIAACAPGESVEVLGRGTVQRPMPVTRAAGGT